MIELVEIHSRSFVLRWVNASPGSTLYWSVKPLKKSIDFGIYLHASTGVVELEPMGKSFSDRLLSSGFETVAAISRIKPNVSTGGAINVPEDFSGMYAFVFDNQFSKQIAKTVEYSFFTSKPTDALERVETLDGACCHSHSQTELMGTTSSPDGRYMTGTLLKKRRRKLQGYARRYFSLDSKRGLLSYYLDSKSAYLRGVMPLKICEINVSHRGHAFSLDSGLETWYIRAPSSDTAKKWITAIKRVQNQAKHASSQAQASELTNVSSQHSFRAMTRSQSLSDGEQTEASVACQDELQISPSVGDLVDTREQVNPVKLSLDLLALTETFKHSNPTGYSLHFANEVERIARELDNLLPELPATISKKKRSRIKIRSFIWTATSVTTSFVVTAGGLVRGGFESIFLILAVILIVGFWTYMSSPEKEIPIWEESDASESSDYDSDSKTSSDPTSAANSLHLPRRFKSFKDQNDIIVRVEPSSQSPDSSSQASFEEVVKSVSGPHGIVSPPLADIPVKRGSYVNVGPEIEVSEATDALAPLPLSPVKRRDDVQRCEYTPPGLKELLQKVRSSSIKDIGSVPAPVTSNEPLSILQSMAEEFEHSYLLDRAAAAHGDERVMLVATFGVSSLSRWRVRERSQHKSFNSLLGETYEMVREDKELRFVSEKVSHHPPVLAAQAESYSWLAHFTSRPHTKFNKGYMSAEYVDTGLLRITFEDKEVITILRPECALKNLLMGERYIQPHGSFSVESNRGPTAIVEFKSQGIFGGRVEDMRIVLAGKTSCVWEGKWTQAVYKGKYGSSEIVWKAGELLKDAEAKFGWTKFTASLNEITCVEKGKLPPNDSRLRPDQRCLETMNIAQAERIKTELETHQRERRAALQSENKTWSPFFFTKSKGSDGLFVLQSGPKSYWERRIKNDWSDIPNYMVTCNPS